MKLYKNYLYKISLRLLNVISMGNCNLLFDDCDGKKGLYYIIFYRFRLPPCPSPTLVMFVCESSPMTNRWQWRRWRTREKVSNRGVKRLHPSCCFYPVELNLDGKKCKKLLLRSTTYRYIYPFKKHLKLHLLRVTSKYISKRTFPTKYLLNKINFWKIFKH